MRANAARIAASETTWSDVPKRSASEAKGTPSQPSVPSAAGAKWALGGTSVFFPCAISGPRLRRSRASGRPVDRSERARRRGDVEARSETRTQTFDLDEHP